MGLGGAKTPVGSKKMAWGQALEDFWSSSRAGRGKLLQAGGQNGSYSSNLWVGPVE